MIAMSQIVFFKVQTERISVYPPPPQTVSKMGFLPREPGRALQVPTPPILGVLNSIMRLITLPQALEHPKMCFSEASPTDFLFIHPPQKGCRKWGFSTREPGRALQVPSSPSLGC